MDCSDVIPINLSRLVAYADKVFLLACDTDFPVGEILRRAPHSPGCSRDDSGLSSAGARQKMDSTNLVIKKTESGYVFVQEVKKALGLGGKGRSLMKNIAGVLGAAGFENIEFGMADGKPTLLGFTIVTDLSDEMEVSPASTPRTNGDQAAGLLTTPARRTDTGVGSDYGDPGSAAETHMAVSAVKISWLESHMAEVKHERDVLIEKLRDCEQRFSDQVVDFTQVKCEREFMAQQLQSQEAHISGLKADLTKVLMERDILAQRLREAESRSFDHEREVVRLESEREILIHQARSDKEHLSHQLNDWQIRCAEQKNDLIRLRSDLEDFRGWELSFSDQKQEFAQMRFDAALSSARKSLLLDEQETRRRSEAERDIEWVRLEGERVAAVREIELKTTTTRLKAVLQAAQSLYQSVNALQADRCLCCAPEITRGGVHSLKEAPASRAAGPEDTKGRAHLVKLAEPYPSLCNVRARLDELRRIATRKI
jgi:hypothetical protein